MSTRFTENTTKTIGTFLSLTVLMYAVIFLHVWWDLKRWEEFAASLMGFLQSEDLTNRYSKGVLPTYNIELDPVGIEMEIEAPWLEAFDSFIGGDFLTEIKSSGEVTRYTQREGVKEEEGTQTDQFQEDIDSTSPFPSLFGSGTSENLATLVEMLKRLAESP